MLGWAGLGIVGRQQRCCHLLTLPPCCGCVRVAASFPGRQELGDRRQEAGAPQLSGVVRMVGVTYRSNSARPNNAASKFVFPAAAQAQDSAAQRGPAPSFKADM